MFSFICVWINDWVNNREAGDLRRYSGHYDVIVMDVEVNLRWLEKNDNDQWEWIPRPQQLKYVCKREMWGKPFSEAACQLTEKTSTHVNAFRITGHLWGESTSGRWIPSQRVNNVEICFLCCQPEQSVEHAVEFPVIWDAMTLIWLHCQWHILAQTRQVTNRLGIFHIILTVYVLNFSEGTNTCIFISCHSSTLTWHR